MRKHRKLPRPPTPCGKFLCRRPIVPHRRCPRIGLTRCAGSPLRRTSLASSRATGLVFKRKSIDPGQLPHSPPEEGTSRDHPTLHRPQCASLVRDARRSNRRRRHGRRGGTAAMKLQARLSLKTGALDAVAVGTGRDCDVKTPLQKEAPARCDSRTRAISTRRLSTCWKRRGPVGFRPANRGDAPRRRRPTREAGREARTARPGVRRRGPPRSRTPAITELDPNGVERSATPGTIAYRRGCEKSGAFRPRWGCKNLTNLLLIILSEPEH